MTPRPAAHASLAESPEPLRASLHPAVEWGRGVTGEHALGYLRATEVMVNGKQVLQAPESSEGLSAEPSYVLPPSGHGWKCPC